MSVFSFYVLTQVSLSVFFLITSGDGLGVTAGFMSVLALADSQAQPPQARLRPGANRGDVELGGERGAAPKAEAGHDLARYAPPCL